MQPSQIDMMDEKELRTELEKSVIEIISLKKAEWKIRVEFLNTNESLNSANEIIDEQFKEIEKLKAENKCECGSVPIIVNKELKPKGE